MDITFQSFNGVLAKEPGRNLLGVGFNREVFRGEPNLLIEVVFWCRESFAVSDFLVLWFVAGLLEVGSRCGEGNGGEHGMRGQQTQGGSSEG